MATSLTSSTANPYVESSSGLGNTPSLQSRKAQKLADIQAYEEDNYTRVFMNKKDAKRRRLDEEDIALGGTGSREDYLKGSKGVRGQKAAGFENEFDDLLSSIGKKRKTGAADGCVAIPFPFFSFVTPYSEIRVLTVCPSCFQLRRPPSNAKGEKASLYREWRGERACQY